MQFFCPTPASLAKQTSTASGSQPYSRAMPASVAGKFSKHHNGAFGLRMMTRPGRELTSAHCALFPAQLPHRYRDTKFLPQPRTHAAQVQFLGGRYAAQAHVRSFMFVGPSPFHCVLLRPLDAFGQIEPQPLMPDRAIVALDMGTQLGFPGLDTGGTSPAHRGRGRLRGQLPDYGPDTLRRRRLGSQWSPPDRGGMAADLLRHAPRGVLILQKTRRAEPFNSLQRGAPPFGDRWHGTQSRYGYGDCPPSLWLGRAQGPGPSWPWPERPPLDQAQPRIGPLQRGSRHHARAPDRKSVV